MDNKIKLKVVRYGVAQDDFSDLTYVAIHLTPLVKEIPRLILEMQNS